jgi:predicted deacylase
MIEHGKLLETMLQGERPIVYVNACTHGNEKVGARILEALKDVRVRRGTLVTNIANQEAFSLNKRFVDQDLNRVFPGKPDGCHEERLAHSLLPLVQAADVVVDIHSTESGKHSALIVTKLDGPTVEVIRFVNPKRTVLMSATKDNSLISAAKVGIGFEYGKDGDEATYQGTLDGILDILGGLGMVEGRPKERKKPQTEFYRVSGPLRKEKGFTVEKGVRNFVLVRKGQVVARSGHGELLAPRDFYPVLFGRNTYTEIFGFMGERMDVGW